MLMFMIRYVQHNMQYKGFDNFLLEVYPVNLASTLEDLYTTMFILP